jgi:hypothetical protein
MSFWGRATFKALDMAIVSKQKKKALTAMERENEINRGIYNAGHVPVESYFEPNEAVKNIVFSGGNSVFRSRAAVQAAVNAFSKNRPVIIIHEGERMLEKSIQTAFKPTGKLEIVNKNNPCFDPFFNLSAQDIAAMVLNSVTGSYPINHVGKYYLEGIAELAKARRFDPLCRHFIRCPHATIIDVVDELVNRNTIAGAEGQKIKSKLMQGQAENSRIDAFFQAFNSEIGALLVSGSKNRSYTKPPVNIISAGRDRGIICIDVLSNLNNIAINMLVSQFEHLVRSGGNPFLVLDSLSTCGADRLAALLMTKSANYNYFISSDDIYAMVGSEESVYNTIIGNSNRLFVSSHSCGMACDKLAETLGCYDKQVPSHSYGSFMSNLNISIQKEHRIKPAEINGMRSEEVFVYDYGQGSLSYASMA